ncbi:hypothetical protein C0995_011007 [Termitomyces sp. Mi166|nr:hypothetical protein C0995_011007 [Termitomyces sp. Mi166\
MAAASFAYSESYYAPADPFYQHDYPMSPHNHHPMPPPPEPPVPIDPALTLYPPYFSHFQPQPQPQPIPQHLALPAYSSPSSAGSDTLGTPPTEHIYPSPPAFNPAKRPASVISNPPLKKSRKDDDPDDKDEPKPKPTRGSRACTVCRRLKMKCVGAEQGGPCKRCTAGNHECIFEESNRGKRTSKKHELLTRSLRKMERALDTVLRSVGNPAMTSAMVSRSPSPSARAQAAGTSALLASPSAQAAAGTSALLASSPSPPPSHYQQQSPDQNHGQDPGSPKLHSLPDNALNPLGLLAEASLANRRAQNPKKSPFIARGDETGEQPQMGVASDNYFKPGPMTILPLRRLYIERQIQPEMLSFVSTEDVVALFNIFFDHIAMHCNLLDRSFHTPSLVCSRSPFLLTTICSIASKYYTAKPDLHPRLTELAKKMAFSVPAQGYKSLEIVQAYLLLVLWGCGAVERYEQDKTWLLLGMAIRMATDLNLHRKTTMMSIDTEEGRARDLEVHNRERTWILCFCLDRSFSAQMGKPHSIKEDAIIRNSSKWCFSPIAAPSDTSICAYAELQRVLSRCLDFLYSGNDTPSGLLVHADYMLIIKSFEAQLLAWKDTWIMHRDWTRAYSPPLPSSQYELTTQPQLVTGLDSEAVEYKRLMAHFYYNYAVLVINSFGLQNALERSPVDLGHFFAQCHSSATACAVIVRDHLGPKEYMKYAPDTHCVMTSYALLTLLKLVRPEFHPFLDDEQRTLTLVADVAHTLENCAANPLHTPALYAHFLRALINAKSSSINTTTTATTENDMNTDAQSLDAQTFSTQQQQQEDTPANPADPAGTTSPTTANAVANAIYSVFGLEPGYSLNPFGFESEMGPVADVSTFPPTMAPNPPGDNMASLTMDNILGSGFWDSVIVPGYNSMDGLTGGFLFGAGGSGLITPRFGMSPIQSGANTPAQRKGQDLTQSSINAAFRHKQIQDATKVVES